MGRHVLGFVRSEEEAGLLEQSEIEPIIGTLDDSAEQPALDRWLIKLWLVPALLLVVTGCGKHPHQEAEKMAIQTVTAKSLDSLRSGDDAAYIAMVRAENETDLGFKVGGIFDIIWPEPGSGWEEETLG